MKKQTIIIIGAGTTGLSTALEIAKKSTGEVIVLDKGYVGSGQTGQCCGLVRSFYNAPEMIFSAQYSTKKILDICKPAGGLEYVKKGLLVVDSLDYKGELQENVELLKKHGVKARFLDSSAIKKINPHIRVMGICAGLDENAGYINPRIVVDYLVIKCKSLGVKIFENHEVENLSTRNGKFIVTTNNRKFVADKLLNATASYTNQFNQMLGFTLPIKIIKIDNTFYRLPLGLCNYQTAVVDFINNFYIIPHKDFADVGLISIDLKQEIKDISKIKFDESTINRHLSIVSKRLKGAEKSSKLGGFASHIDINPDYYPILSKIDTVPNYYVATGFSGTGFKHFPIIGLILSEIILDKKPTFPDLVKFFRYDRFLKNNSKRIVRDSYFVNG